MAKNTIRSGQTVTTFGPGAMIDLPDSAIMVGGLEFWNYDNKEQKPIVEEPRLLATIRKHFEGLDWTPPQYLFRPPTEKDFGHGFSPHIVGWEFPEWYMVQKSEPAPGNIKRRRLVPKSMLEKKGKIKDDASGKFLSVVPIRFVRACNKGHCDDIDWRSFVRGAEGGNCGEQCLQPLYIEERNSSGTLADTWIKCGCGAERSMSQAAKRDSGSLGRCSGRRPWLGAASKDPCTLPSRLLIRSASNAYFPQLLSVISIPDSGSELTELVGKLWEKGLQGVADGEMTLSGLRKYNSEIGATLEPYSDEEVEKAISIFLGKVEADADRKVKSVELEALTRAEAETGTDEPDGDFYARELDEEKWRPDAPWMDGFQRIVLVHRLREVVAQLAFTRFESITPSLSGEYDDELAIEVEPAVLSRSENWLPAMENRGEGIFLQFDSGSILEWSKKPEVKERAAMLEAGFLEKFDKGDSSPTFHGAAFYMVHSLSHLLINQIALECGYPSSSLRERIYAENGTYGILIYTGSPDAEGTLGGLVESGKNISGIVRRALQSARLCSNDPVCAGQKPNHDTQRELLGAACHGCLLIAETSCEQRNCFLDRSLVVDSMNNAAAHFFTGYEV
ncbi:MAG: DUF1998 domain-containing protein [Verrucomicrobiales bacterium]|nr:DUF1998 domain-containing protein [Verrucomicrobiales bacterium]